MILQPTPGQLIRTVRSELLNTIAPVIDDPKLSQVIEMMASILYSAAQRSDNEIHWMRESAEEIDKVASAVLAEHSANAPTLRDAHQRFANGAAADPRAAYDRASEVLAALLEESLHLPGDVQRQADLLLQQRLKIEQEILGEFRVAGR